MTAATQVNMVNSWMVGRNAINRGLLRNAARSAAQEKFDPEPLLPDVTAQYRTIRLGDEGKDVETLQGFLDFPGYPLAVTGVFDEDTKAQVIAFQTAGNNLPNGGGNPADGIAGRLTWAAPGYQVPGQPSISRFHSAKTDCEFPVGRHVLKGFKTRRGT